MATITVTVSSGTHTAETLEEANALALADACAQVAALRVLDPCLEPGLTELGSLWAWGQNSTHMLGVGDDLLRSTPVLVEEEETGVHWTQVALGRFHSAAVKSDGTLWTWGQNTNGQLGNGFSTTFPSTVYDAYFPTQVGTDTDWEEVSCNNFHTIARKETGTIWGFGYNGDGAQGRGTGMDGTLTLVPTQIGSASNWVQISAGRQHSLFLNEDGEIWGCGSTLGAAMGPGFPSDHLLTQVVAPGVWSWISASDGHSECVKADGTLWRFGDGNVNSTIVQIGTDTDWVSVGAGPLNIYRIAKKSNGTLWSMGSNSFGQLGLGDTTTRTSMTQIGTSTWQDYSVSSNGSYVVAVKSDGTMWGWGGDSQFQLGQAAASSIRHTPVQIGPDNFWLRCAAGQNYSCGLRSTLAVPPPPASVSGVMLGGSVTIAGGYHIHVWEGSAYEVSGASAQVMNGSGVLFDVLIVGAGGGGGALGGGGGGDYIKLTGVSLSNGNYPMTLGGRGFGGGGTESPGQDGGTTIFNGNTAIGGGGGGAHTVAGTGNGPGRTGASGGGGGGSPDGGPGGYVGGTGTAGSNGGDGLHGLFPYQGGGGGGSGGAGTAATSGVGGVGGAGTSDSITGSAVFYCAGGGGVGSTTSGEGGSASFGVSAGGEGGIIIGETAKTFGSGGGGGSVAGDGGKGCVIIRYLTPV